jgi:hypothetical protein
MDQHSISNIKILEVGAFTGFFASILTPANISIAAGCFSLVLSFTGIVLNLINIYKKTKEK